MQAAGRGKHRNRRRADHVQVETLTPQQVRRVCTADSVSALVSDPQTAGADSAGLAWYAGCADLYGVRRGAGIWYRCMLYRRCYTLQRGADSVISAFVGLVSATVELGKSQEKRL